ncbi:MAG: DUF4115 domain-containing protein, partial [Gammaproteobacteria bacterium]|nr:DUF4115 domain-containing protein [Gammaproteobacteria bacterium]
AGQAVKFSPAVIFYSFFLLLIVCVIWFVSSTDDNEMSDITDVQTSLINAVEITDAMVVDDMGAVKNDIPVITEENMQPIVIDDSNVPNGIEKLDGESELVLEYIEESWTDIKDANGKQLVYRMAKKGSVINLTSVSPFNILLGYSSGVIVKYNGEIFNHSAYARDNVAYFTVGKKITKVDKEKPGETIVKKMPAVLDKQEIIVPPVIKEKDAVTTLPVVNEKITEEVEPVNDVITTDEKIQKKEIMFELFPD